MESKPVAYEDYALIGLGLIALIFSITAQTLLPLRHIKFAFHVEVFLFVGFLLMPITMAFSAVVRLLRAKSGERIFNIQNPTVSRLISSTEPLNLNIDRIMARLKELSFKYELQTADSERSLIKFRKEKQGFVTTFLDHAFSGVIEVASARENVNFNCTLTMNDTLLIETNEFASLENIIEYLFGKTKVLKINNTSLNLACALVLATLNLFLWSTFHFRFPEILPFCYTAPFLVAGLLAFSIQSVFINKTIAGYIECALCVILSAIPFWAL